MNQPFQKRRGRVFGRILVPVVLLAAVAACGSDDGAASSETTVVPADSAATTDGVTETTGVATTEAAPSEDDGSGDTLRVAYSSALVSADPTLSTSSRDAQYIWTVYDSLLGFDRETLTPGPGLATSWDQPDPTTLVFHLREGVTFHDDTPFNAEAVKFNIERAKGETSTLKGDLVTVDSVEVVDDLTVQFNLTQPDARLLTALSDKAGMMVSPTAAEAGDLANHPVGTGPWKFVSLDPGALLVVEKWDGYWDKDAVRVDRIEFHTIGEAATASNALRSGEIDMIANVQASEALALEKEDFNVVQSSSLETLFFIFNVERPPLDNPMVREAINLAVDREQIVEVSEFGMATPTNAILPKTSWAYPKSAVEVTRDVEKAKELLTEAGFPDGVSFQAMVHTTAYDQRRAELVQSELAEAGINMEIIQLDLGVNALRFYVDQEFDSMLADFGGRPDPGTAYDVLFSSTGFLNPGKYATPGLDELILQANAESDQSVRAGLLDDVNTILQENSRYVPIFAKPFIMAMSNNVQGYVPVSNGKPLFVGITLSDS